MFGHAGFVSPWTPVLSSVILDSHAAGPDSGRRQQGVPGAWFAVRNLMGCFFCDRNPCAQAVLHPSISTPLYCPYTGQSTQRGHPPRKTPPTVHRRPGAHDDAGDPTLPTPYRGLVSRPNQLKCFQCLQALRIDAFCIGQLRPECPRHALGEIQKINRDQSPPGILGS